jgi:hypothetical protein
MNHNGRRHSTAVAPYAPAAARTSFMTLMSRSGLTSVVAGCSLRGRASMTS